MSGNQVIREILRESAEVMRESQRMPYYRRGARNATFTEHSAIIEALAARQPEQAQRAMERHIMLAARRAGVHFPTGTRRRIELSGCQPSRNTPTARFNPSVCCRCTRAASAALATNSAFSSNAAWISATRRAIPSMSLR